nr:MAG TPA: hypothetical protein [Caudoviricetes sp.]
MLDSRLNMRSNIVDVNKIAKSGCKPLVDSSKIKKPSCANRRATSSTGR